jgi:hypothetical protein
MAGNLTVSPRHPLFHPVAFCAALILLAGCKVPDRQPPAYTTVGHTQILRAESVEGGTLFPAPVNLNVPATSAGLNDAARYLAGLPPMRGQDAFPKLRAFPS